MLYRLSYASDRKPIIIQTGRQIARCSEIFYSVALQEH